MCLKLHHDADKTPSGCNFIFLLVGKMRHVWCVCSSFEGDGNVFRKLPINKQGNDVFTMLPCLFCIVIRSNLEKLFLAFFAPAVLKGTSTVEYQVFGSRILIYAEVAQAFKLHFVHHLGFGQFGFQLAVLQYL